MSIIIIAGVITLVVLTVIDLVLLKLRQLFFVLYKERKWIKELDAEIENMGPDFDENAVCKNCDKRIFGPNPLDFENTCGCWLASEEELKKLLDDDDYTEGN